MNGGNAGSCKRAFAANPKFLPNSQIPKRKNEVIEQRNKQMKLLNYTYMKLIEIDEIETAEELSQNWCKKNRNWFAWQKHAGHDFSIDAAINCLAKTRQRLVERQDKAGWLKWSSC